MDFDLQWSEILEEANSQLSCSYPDQIVSIWFYQQKFHSLFTPGDAKQKPGIMNKLDYSRTWLSTAP